MGKGDPSIMDGSPRKPMEPILNRANWYSITAYTACITISVLFVFLFALFYSGYDEVICNNIAFFTLALAQLLHPLNLIELKDKYFDNEIIKNPHLWSAVLFCIVLLLGAYQVDRVSQILNLVSLSIDHLYLILGGSLLPLLLIRLAKMSRIIS
jgi:Ca2+-transporting ATPase